VLLGIPSAAARHFDYGTGTLCGRPFNAVHLYRACQRVLRQKYVKVPLPRPCNACRLSHMIGLASSGFARHYLRNRGCFLFLWVLRCFTSPRSLYPPYIFRRESLGRIATPSGVSPFGNPRIKALLSAPRGLSQIYTSFIGSRCQGIHRSHLET
jgi:hypothetical protein